MARTCRERRFGVAACRAAYPPFVRRFRSPRTSGPTASPGPSWRRHRDRRGRGIRGPLAPRGVPLARTRAERFDDLVLDAVERLERRWSRELDGVEFGVEDVPPAGVPGGPLGEPVPLGRVLRIGAHPPRIVIYRRPVEARAIDLQELSALVHDVVVEQVADLLGMEPEAVDPRYDY
jgi:hypothetical protein